MLSCHFVIGVISAIHLRRFAVFRDQVVCFRDVTDSIPRKYSGRDLSYIRNLMSYG